MELILTGSKGPQVELLQQRLTSAGYCVTVSGKFGDDTAAAVIALQRAANLVVDGVVGDKTRAALLKRDTSHLLSQADIEAAARVLGVDLACVHAVKAVESRGHGFLEDGRPVILYERHVMRKRLAQNGVDANRIAQLAERHPALVNKTPGGYKGGATEHYRLQLARGIDDTSALESCSWGLFQIMGYHWQALEYASIHDFVDRMQRSEGEQLDAFVRFVAADAKLHTALQGLNWTEFARRYNGPAYRKNKYDERLVQAHAGYRPVAA
ncbi:N-acetylmuramidase domain-containing protein [Marinobacterium sedimentorum]|uniref:N-acetylmuramidase domain-containing protein n=1 Tax=Marinobacterium sedimentorum TaxID=2927804 RepID=UPI0020C616CA|nr:N-acetylmuramidase family protein [Marinobacterium sedimentorum]MCP8687760.1 N-acetylmuramidase family protein [Marinobacterium sedimentorum]